MDYCQSNTAPKKHPCPDCTFCQWCADSRCNMCLREQGACRKAARKKASGKKSKSAKKKR